MDLKANLQPQEPIVIFYELFKDPIQDPSLISPTPPIPEKPTSRLAILSPAHGVTEDKQSIHSMSVDLDELVLHKARAELLDRAAASL